MGWEGWVEEFTPKGNEKRVVLPLSRKKCVFSVKLRLHFAFFRVFESFGEKKSVGRSLRPSFPWSLSRCRIIGASEAIHTLDVLCDATGDKWFCGRIGVPSNPLYFNHNGITRLITIPFCQLNSISILFTFFESKIIAIPFFQLFPISILLTKIERETRFVMQKK